MMSDLFHSIAADDQYDRRQMHVATTVANKRVKDQYGAFLSNSTDLDRKARIALIEDEIRSTIASVGEEYGIDTDVIQDSIIRNLARGNADHLKDYQFKKKDDPKDTDEEREEDEDALEEEIAGKPKEGGENPKTASVKEARRPKMCPYHSEVVDISLGTNDPQSGYNAMSNQAWGDKHCKGGFDGSCNFKPQMVTQKYWDDKKNEYEERARQRQVDQEQRIVEPLVPSIEATEPVMNPEPFPEGDGEGITDLDSELAEAPSAVGEHALAHTAFDASLPSDYEAYGHPGDPCPQCQGTGSNPQYERGPCPFCEGSGHAPEGQTDIIDSGFPHKRWQSHTAADQPAGVGGARKRVSLPKANPSGLGGPSPKIDKGNSGDEWGWSLDDIDTQMDGSPHPTEHQDITDLPDFSKDDFLDQADTKIKQVELDTAGDFEAGFADGGETHEEGPFTFTEDNGTDPVTRVSLPQTYESSHDPENPLRGIIDSNFGGFTPSAEVDAAIRDFE